MHDDLRIPDIEVIVGASGDDVAVVAFYKRDDIHQGYEAVCAVANPHALPVIRQILQDCIQALNTVNWHTMDELREDPPENEGGAPF